MTGKKVGILGGTFDPIHLGHLIGAEHAREAAGLEEVWLMPNRIPPHKGRGTGASAAHRLKMAELAAAGNPALRADDTEVRKEGVSYTVETMRLLTERNPDTEFHLIIGADMVNYLPQWYRIEELLRLVRFVGLSRQGVKLALGELPSGYAERISQAPMPPIGISSTDIRERLGAGRSVRYLVPDPVYDYMKEHRLYGLEA